MIWWFIAVIAAFALALVFIPRKKPYEPTPEEVVEMKKLKYELFLKEEKDTKRFYEDIRGLYPL
jgi:hypothetical protein